MLLTVTVGFSQYDDLYYDPSYDGYTGGNEHLTTDTTEEDGTTYVTNNYYMDDRDDYYFTRRIRLRYFRFWRPYFYANWYYPSYNYYSCHNYNYWGYHSITYMNPYYSYYYPNYYYNNYNYTTYYNKTYKKTPNTYYGHRTSSSTKSGGKRKHTNTNSGKKVIVAPQARTRPTRTATVKKNVVRHNKPTRSYSTTNRVSNNYSKNS